MPFRHPLGVGRHRTSLGKSLEEVGEFALSQLPQVRIGIGPLAGRSVSSIAAPTSGTESSVDSARRHCLC
jgi:hypothetical protein